MIRGRIFSEMIRIQARKSWGCFQRGVFVRGEISIIGVARTPVAIINFAFFVRGLLIESYINSEIFTRLWRKINFCNRCAHHPSYWDFPPSQKPPFGNPWKSELQAKSRSYGPKVRVTAGQTPRIRTESHRKGPRMAFRRLYREPP